VTGVRTPTFARHKAAGAVTGRTLHRIGD